MLCHRKEAVNEQHTNCKNGPDDARAIDWQPLFLRERGKTSWTNIMQCMHPPPPLIECVHNTQ